MNHRKATPKRYVPWILGVALGGLILCFSCGPPEKSSSGFHLPDGDIQRGRDAFMELKCNACHRVTGLELPAPVADPEVSVVLGGRRHSVITDGELVTSIIDPSYEVSHRYSGQLVESDGESRMANYKGVMTLQQLVDVIAFLHSRYIVTPPSLIK